MTQLALRLPIFLACSQDARPLRDVLTDVIREAAVHEAAELGLLIEPRHWQSHALPGSGSPQENIDHLITSSELIVGIVCGNAGSGLIYELELALKLAATGDADNVFVYFQELPAETAAAQGGAARALRDRLESSQQLFPGSFKSADDLRRTFGRHLSKWLMRWAKVPDICAHALRNSGALVPAHTLEGENKIHLLRSAWPFNRAPEFVPALGDIATVHYQRTAGDIRRPIGGDLLSTLPNFSSAVSEVDLDRDMTGSLLIGTPSKLARTPLVRSADGALFFGGLEWFWFFCAVGLKAAIARDQSACIEDVPYANPVHQYLRALFDRQDVGAAAATLTSWLVSSSGVQKPPVVRNFAAYVLGMLGARQAQDALARAAVEDSGIDVRRYCITSLGKLRARRHLPLLSALFTDETDPELRLLISQAVCRVVRVAEFPL